MISKFHSKYKFDQILSDSSLLSFYQKAFYMKEQRKIMTANNSQIICDERVKSDLRQRPRIGTTQIYQNGKYRAPSTCAPTLEDDLMQDSWNSNGMRVPPINLGGIHLDNITNKRNGDSFNNSVQPIEMEHFMQSSYRGQTQNAIERFNNSNIIQPLPSPMMSEFRTKYVDQDKSKITMNQSNISPSKATDVLSGK